MDASAWALKKDVASCDKPRVAAGGLRSGDLLMGPPAVGNHRVPGPRAWDREPPERKHPSRGRKRNQNGIPLVTASERGGAQTEPPWATMEECGVMGRGSVLMAEPKSPGMGRHRG